MKSKRNLGGGGFCVIVGGVGWFFFFFFCGSKGGGEGIVFVHFSGLPEWIISGEGEKRGGE